ncbi:MAG: J domain-containing protein [Candidatus Limnocylindria bacterium]
MTDPYKVLQVLPTAEQEVVRAAFRALALKYHPDHDSSARAARRMIELNEAYAMVREPEARAQLDRARLRKYNYEATPAGNGDATTPPPPRSSSAGTQLDQGRYAGWTLRDVAAHDPDYLRWLSRHSSGLRYRSEIARLLAGKGASVA